MEESWQAFFNVNPLSAMQQTTNPSLQYFIQRDLLDQDPGSVEQLWTLPDVVRLLKKQLNSGAWPDPRYKQHIDSPTNYLVLETYRNLGILIELFGLNKSHPQIQQAAEYLFSTQTAEGDFRGIYGTQYSPNYGAGVLELLVKAGYREDERIYRAFQWFISHPQNEGGWTAPIQTQGIKMYECEEIMRHTEALQFESTKPFSHSITGIVLRAFAAHPKYRDHPSAKKAGELITHRFFKADKYSSRQAVTYWTKYSFPFWWFDLISVLDALALMGFPKDHPRINRALNYFKTEQHPSGIWKFYILKNQSQSDLNSWLSYVLCRAIKRIYQNSTK